LDEYSYTNSESLVQMRATFAEIYFFSRGLFLVEDPVHCTACW